MKAIDVFCDSMFATNSMQQKITKKTMINLDKLDMWI